MRKFIKSLYFTCGLICLALIARASNGPSPWTTKSSQDLSRELRKALFTKQYFKNATCKELADYELSQNGLPKIGATFPIVGVRQTVDRQNEDKSLPEFKDSVIHRERPWDSFKISSQTRQNQWTLVTEREVEMTEPGKHRHLNIQIEYHFKSENFDNRGSCALDGFIYQARLDRDPEAVSYQMNLDSCLDVMLRVYPSTTSKDVASNVTTQALRDACITSMHYSAQAKEIARHSH